MTEFVGVLARLAAGEVRGQKPDQLRHEQRMVEQRGMVRRSLRGERRPREGPGTQLYGACKAFIDHLTVPLAFEYGRHLDVLSFQPTVMATAMAAGTEPTAITISPQAAARAALAHLGCCVSSLGHWRHALLSAFFSALPTRLRNRIFMSTALEMAAVELAKEH